MDQCSRALRSERSHPYVLSLSMATIKAHLFNHHNHHRPARRSRWRSGRSTTASSSQGGGPGAVTTNSSCCTRWRWLRACVCAVGWWLGRVGLLEGAHLGVCNNGVCKLQKGM